MNSGVTRTTTCLAILALCSLLFTKPAEAEPILLSDVSLTLTPDSSTEFFIQFEDQLIPIDLIAGLSGYINMDLRIDGGQVTGLQLRNNLVFAEDATGLADAGTGDYVNFRTWDVSATSFQEPDEFIELAVPNAFDAGDFYYVFASGMLEYEGFGPVGSIIGIGLADLADLPASRNRTNGFGEFEITPTGNPGELLITLTMPIEYDYPIGEGFSAFTVWDITATAIVTVPEPGSWALLTVGVFAMAPLARRLRR